MAIAKEAGMSDDSARRPLDRHLRYNDHKFPAAPGNRLGDDVVLRDGEGGKPWMNTVLMKKAHIH